MNEFYCSRFLLWFFRKLPERKWPASHLALSSILHNPGFQCRCFFFLWSACGSPAAPVWVNLETSNQQTSGPVRESKRFWVLASLKLWEPSKHLGVLDYSETFASGIISFMNISNRQKFDVNFFFCCWCLTKASLLEKTFGLKLNLHLDEEHSVHVTEGLWVLGLETLEVSWVQVLGH